MSISAHLHLALVLIYSWLSTIVCLKTNGIPPLFEETKFVVWRYRNYCSSIDLALTLPKGEWLMMLSIFERQTEETFSHPHEYRHTHWQKQLHFVFLSLKQIIETYIDCIQITVKPLFIQNNSINLFSIRALCLDIFNKTLHVDVNFVDFNHHKPHSTLKI